MSVIFIGPAHGPLAGEEAGWLTDPHCVQVSPKIHPEGRPVRHGMC